MKIYTYLICVLLIYINLIQSCTFDKDCIVSSQLLYSKGSCFESEEGIRTCILVFKCNNEEMCINEKCNPISVDNNNMIKADDNILSQCSVITIIMLIGIMLILITGIIVGMIGVYRDEVNRP